MEGNIDEYHELVFQVLFQDPRGKKLLAWLTKIYFECPLPWYDAQQRYDEKSTLMRIGKRELIGDLRDIINNKLIDIEMEEANARRTASNG